MSNILYKGIEGDSTIYNVEYNLTINGGDSVVYHSAHSIFKLRPAYTGNCLRVRRSSDNTLQNIGFNSSDVLDSSALLLFVGSGDGFVETLYDQSGNNRNYTQSTASSQPLIVSSGNLVTSNLAPALSFDGVDDFMTLTPYSITPFNHQLEFIFEPAAIITVSSSGILMYGDNGIETEVVFGNRTGTLTNERITWFATDRSAVRGWGYTSADIPASQIKCKFILQQSYTPLFFFDDASTTFSQSSSGAFTSTIKPASFRCLGCRNRDGVQSAFFAGKFQSVYLMP